MCRVLSTDILPTWPELLKAKNTLYEQLLTAVLLFIEEVTFEQTEGPI